MQLDKFLFSSKFKLRGLQLGDEISTDINNYTIIARLQQTQLVDAPATLYPGHMQVQDGKVQLSEFTSAADLALRSNHQARQYSLTIHPDTGNAPMSTILNQVYTCTLNPERTLLRLSTTPRPAPCLAFTQVHRPRFVRTAMLERILAGQMGDEQGVVTMDQSGRFLLESTGCRFHALGIWMGCADVRELGVYERVRQFLGRRPGKGFSKVCLVVNERQYVVFVKLSSNQAPQLYLVSWKVAPGREQGRCYQREYYIHKNKEIKLQFSPESLQFTLRAKDRPSFDSPSKQKDDLQLEEQLERLHLRESPQFSSIKKQSNQWVNWPEQKAQLTQKVQDQALEITKLKAQIERLAKQLSNSRKCVTSPPTKPLISFRSPLLMPQSSTPAEKAKRLSESDLEASNLKSFASGSTKEKRSQENGSSLQSSSNKKQIVSFDQDPWDMMQIIQ